MATGKVAGKERTCRRLPELSPLVFPKFREWMQKPVQRHGFRFAAIENCLDDVRREQREPRDAAEV